MIQNISGIGPSVRSRPVRPVPGGERAPRPLPPDPPSPDTKKKTSPETFFTLLHPVNNPFPHFWTWIPDTRPFQPVLGRTFHVESEFETKNQHFQRPGTQNIGKATSTNICLNFKLTYVLCFLNWQLGLIHCESWSLYFGFPAPM